MARFWIVVGLVLLSSLSVLYAEEPDDKILITRASRELDLASQVVKQGVSLTILNEGDLPANSFLYTIDNVMSDKLAYIEAKVSHFNKTNNLLLLVFVRGKQRNLYLLKRRLLVLIPALRHIELILCLHSHLKKPRLSLSILSSLVSLLPSLKRSHSSKNSLSSLLAMHMSSYRIVQRPKILKLNCLRLTLSPTHVLVLSQVMELKLATGLTMIWLPLAMSV